MAKDNVSKIKNAQELEDAERCYYNCVEWKGLSGDLLWQEIVSFNSGRKYKSVDFGPDMPLPKNATIRKIKLKPANY